MFEHVNLERTGCPNIPLTVGTNVQVFAGGWLNLAAPYGSAATPAATDACVRSYYRHHWYNQLWSWAGYYTTPTWLMPFGGGQARQITTMPGDGTHATQPNRYAYDFSGPLGSDFVATRGGTVVRVVQGNPDSGCCIGTENYIFVNHGDGYYSLYVHLKQNSSYVSEGAVVKAGQKLAQVGNSGHSTGPHLHFMVDTGWTAQLTFSDSVPITFDDIIPAYGSPGPVSDNWPQP